MKNTDLLDAIGEADAAYYEDLAESLSGRRQKIRRIVSRCAAAAAVITVMTVTAVTFVSIFREGIVQQQPAGSSSQTADSGPDASADTPASDEPMQTLRTDLFEMAETTTVTTASEPRMTTPAEVTLPFPADAEMPDNNLQQEVGNRFLVNSLSTSGVLAFTLQDVQLYDSLVDAGLTFDDLTESFRSEQASLKDFYEGRIFNISGSLANEALRTMMDPGGGEENQQNWRFIKATITVENLNAVSSLAQMNGAPMPDGSICNYSYFDFPINSYGFCVLPNREKIIAEGRSYAASRCSMWGMQYNTAEGMFYDDANRRDLIHVEPGEAVSFEIGSFVPKIYTQFVDERTMSLGYEIGTDLKPYYMFGISLSRPYVEFHFDD